MLGLDPNRIHARFFSQNLADFQFQQIFLKSNDWEDSTYALFKKTSGVHLPVGEAGGNCQDPDSIAYFHAFFVRWLTTPSKHP
jgi:hypothetical protein